MSAPCADKVGIEGEAIDGCVGMIGSALYDPRADGQPRSRQGVAPKSLTLTTKRGLRRQQKPRLDGRGSELSESGGESWWLLENSSRRDAGLVVRRLAQHVTAAPHGLDVVLAVGRIRELLAQLADEDVDDLEL